jgi:hypothetical protein
MSSTVNNYIRIDETNVHQFIDPSNKLTFAEYLSAYCDGSVYLWDDRGQLFETQWTANGLFKYTAGVSDTTTFGLNANEKAVINSTNLANFNMYFYDTRA